MAKYWHIVVALLLAIAGLTINSFIERNSIQVSGQDSSVYHAQYYQLEKFLSYYDSILVHGGWSNIPEVKNILSIGVKDSVVLLLRRRLENENYLEKELITAPDSFTGQMTAALKTFQQNNGLIATGIPDPATIAALNIPAEKKTEQIRINMEQWKTFPIDTGRRYLLVNIPDFNLALIENDSTVLKMKAIVGRTYRKTPVFNARLTHIIFNPAWNIPSTILTEDILPLVLKDTSYLRKRHIRIYQTKKGETRKEVPTDEVDWKTVSEKYFPYELIQNPGKDNALGVVKFMFPNQYNVYMHDTPVKDLFNETERTFSSGCIRISNAIDLAEQLLKGKWRRKKIMQIIQSGETVMVNLPQPVNVYIVYFTAWVDACGKVQFRKDIYERDTTLPTNPL